MILNYDERAKSSRRGNRTTSSFRPTSAALPSLSKVVSEGKSLRVEMEEVQKEIRVIKSVLNRLKEKFSIKMEQNVSFHEFMNVLKEFDIVYPSEKVVKLLVFLELNPNLFSLKEFIINLDSNLQLIQDAK